jgi:hypothetical protein
MAMLSLPALVVALLARSSNGGITMTKAHYGYNCLEFGKYKGDDEYQKGVLTYVKDECEGKEKCTFTFSHSECSYLDAVSILGSLTCSCSQSRGGLRARLLEGVRIQILLRRN